MAKTQFLNTEKNIYFSNGLENRAWNYFYIFPCQPLTLSPPPPPCNVVFDLKAPLGDEKPNQTISARLSLFSDNGV